MSRSGYSEDFDDDRILNLYRASVERSIQGKRGQAFLRDLATALDAMPVKSLIAGELIAPDGSCCAIGAVCKMRGIDVSKIDYYEPDDVGKLVGISRSMAAEIEFENDDDFRYDSLTPEQRWVKMRQWVSDNLTTA